MNKYVFIIEETLKHIHRKVNLQTPNIFILHLIYGYNKLRMVLSDGNVYIFVSIGSVG